MINQFNWVLAQSTESGVTYHIEDPSGNATPCCDNTLGTFKRMIPDEQNQITVTCQDCINK